MTTDEHHDHPDLAEQLAALAEEPAPASALDPRVALARGRARLRRRRRAAIGSVAAVTALVVTGSLMLQSASAGTTVVPPAAQVAAPSPSPAASTPAKGGAGHAKVDPLTTEVRFGWLPEWVNGESGVGYQVGYHGDSAWASGKGDRAARMILSLYPAGQEPPSQPQQGVTVTRTPAPPVNGRSAYFLKADRPDYTGDQYLRWLTPSGRWAEIQAYGGKPDDLSRETLLKVAEGVTYGRTDVPIPLWFSGLPATFKADDVTLSRPSGTPEWPWDVWVMFTIPSEDPTAHPRTKTVSVSVHPDIPVPNPSPEIDGDPTYADPNPPLCRVEQGLRICAGTGGKVLPELEQLGGLAKFLAEHVHITGPEVDTWTTDVLR